MKKQAIVCDLCNSMITTNLKEEVDHCVICQRTVCGDCSAPILELLFDDDRCIMCEKCENAFKDFDHDDYKILNDKFSKELFDMIKKLIMTNEMRGKK